MNTERWQSIREVFERIRRAPESERERILASECRDDPALRAEVEELLARDATASPLDNPPAALGLPAEPSPTQAEGGAPQQSTPPTSIGRFRIVSVLGAGSYGIVYLATDETNGQTLALKVLRTAAPSRDMRRRFEYEAQAITELSHPCVARVYEAATVTSFDGAVTPHIAMEFVDGLSITEYARLHQCSQAQLLNLILHACDGVAHAHQRGIIHRDLKPSNVLVDSTGAVKILDFGLAKFIEREGSSTGTVDGQLLGTPAYMSPEQASGNPERIDTRSDVYSLGAILYEMLGHRPPLIVGSLGVLDAVRVIEQTEPPPLGSIAAACRGDLETIVAKALAKEPLRRYQTVLEFASDIRRFMAEEPVLARPASLGYVLRKFARRHRPLVGTVAVLALAAIIAGVAILAGQREAAKGHQIARELASTLLTQVIGPNWDRIGTVEERRSLLFEIRDRVEQFASRYPDDLAMQGDYARLLSRLADQAESDGDSAAILDYTKRALAVREKLASASPNDPDRQADLSIALVRAGDSAGRVGLHTEQGDAYERAYLVDRSLHQQWPDNPTFANNLAFSHERLAFRAEAARDLPKAIAHATEELKLAEEAMVRRPTELANRWLRASARSSLGSFLRQTGAFDEARRLERLAMDDFDLLTADAPENRRYAIAAVSARIGLSAIAAPTDPEADAVLAEASAMMERLFAADPLDTTVQEMRYSLEAQRIDRSEKNGDEHMFREALRAATEAEAALSRNDPTTMTALLRRAKLFEVACGAAKSFGDSATASQCLDQAIPSLAEACSRPEADGDMFRDYACLLLVATEHPSPDMIAKGVAAAERAIEKRARTPHRAVLALAYAQRHRGNTAEALRTLERAMSLVNPSLEPGTLDRLRRIREQWSGNSR